MVQKIRHYQFKQLFTVFFHPFHVLWSSARREENPWPSMPFCFLLRTSDELDCLIASREDSVSWFRSQTSWRVLHVLRNTWQEDSIPSDETHRSHTWVRAPLWPQIGLSCHLWRVLLVLTHRANVPWSPTLSPGLFCVQGSNSKRGHSRLWAWSSFLCFGVSGYHSSHPPLLPAAQLPVHVGCQPAPPSLSELLPPVNLFLLVLISLFFLKTLLFVTSFNCIIFPSLLETVHLFQTQPKGCGPQFL